MAQLTAVVLDNNQNQREDLRNRLARCGVLPICFKDEWICLENIHHIRPGFAILGTDSYEQASRFVSLSKAIEGNLPIIVLSNNNDIEQFIRNNWLVNLFFLRYPADDKEFQRTMDLLASAKKDYDQPVLIAGSSERKKLLQGIPLLGLSKEPILIQGERGVGKKLISKAIHGFSTVKHAAINFIDAMDVSGLWIREEIERAAQKHPESRHQMVNVIENVENLTFSFQSQLLSLLDGFNGSETGKRDGRVIAPFITITCSDLELLAHNGLFRKDLYHRLSVLKLIVPPLRGHSDDIYAMAEFFATYYGVRRTGGINRLPDEVLKGFVDFRWPGNVTELKRTIQRFLLIDKKNWTIEGNGSYSSTPHGRGKQTTNIYFDSNDVRNFLKENEDISLKSAKNRYAAKIEKKMMKAALVRTNGNCKKAAGLLQISYKSMLNKVKAYQLN